MRMSPSDNVTMRLVSVTCKLGIVTDGIVIR